MLQIENLHKSFGDVRAVDDVTLRFEPGEMVGIIGRSGAGKSTLLRLINRLAEPTGGRILCDGIEVSALKARELRDWRSSCAMIFQQFNLVGRLDVLTNVLIGRSFHQTPFATLFKRYDDAERTEAIQALDRLGLAHQALQRADTLSGGQQQRVAIARALMQRPRVLLADEPIASLDPANASKVMEALSLINRELGITVLCNLHTLDTAREYCRRIVAMANGRVVLDGGPGDLTDARVREIYGVEADDASFKESVTSTKATAGGEVQRVA